MFLKNMCTLFFIGKIGKSFLFALDKHNLCQKKIRREEIKTRDQAAS